jgi:sulfatase modifying factor 1
VLEFTSQTAGVVTWSWKVSTQQDFDWLLCEVDGQEVSGISTKNGVWQTQVVNVPAGATVRWVYRKDASGSIGEDAGYLADVEFRSLAANQSFSQWAQANRISDPQQRMPKSGLQAMFGWLGGFGVDGENTDDHHKQWILSGRLTYRYPISKTADGTQQILYSPDMSSWTTRRFSQRVVSEDADRVVIEATAPSGTKGFFKIATTADANMVRVAGGILPENSELAGTTVSTFKIGRTEVNFREWKTVRDYALLIGYSFDNEGYAPSDNHPVGDVNWYDVVKWCNAKSQQLGLMPVYYTGSEVYKSGQTQPTENASANGYRLPKDAEWEWAARGGTQSHNYIYSGSNQPKLVAWFEETSSGALVAMDPGDPLQRGLGTWPVGTKAANELGIYDMSGNVEEWVSDYVNDGRYGLTAPRRVRGGNWGDPATRITVADRSHGGNADYRFNVFGFRVARNAED